MSSVEEKQQQQICKYQTITNTEDKQLLKIASTSSSTVTKRIMSISTKKNKKLKECIKTAEISEQSFANEKIDQYLQEQLHKKVNNESDEKKQPKIIEKKAKTKKSKSNNEVAGQNISVKSGFSKFDALQKKNLINNPQSEKESNCRLCLKPVYKMEEIKAEKSIYHRSCFRCQECKKQLSVDNYQSHERVLFCLIHFKSLFSPKLVEETVQEKPIKPELIIRENQPAELPPDVVRASDKPNLGLEELSQLNVRQRFQIFETGKEVMSEESRKERECNTTLNNNGVVRKTLILSKLAKLEAHGFTTGYNTESFKEKVDEKQSDNDEDDEDITDMFSNGEKTSQHERERIVGLTEDAMQDIKSKFERGHVISKEEKRVERKQEIQNIRSRLFMGKQAKIKELYQQAVAESERGVVASQKSPEIDFEGAAKDLKERFETGEVYKRTKNNPTTINDEADIFESAITKQSRSIFKELDANSSSNNTQIPHKVVNNTKKEKDLNKIELNDVIKYSENIEDVKVKTSEICEKFKFFETYCPEKHTKKEFRITPPRDENVVKMLSPDIGKKKNDCDTDKISLEKSHTTSKMLSKFREMEQNNYVTHYELKPLKSFTPPPDGGQRKYIESESDYSSQDEFENEEYEYFSKQIDDEALNEAKSSERAKKLRAKFEKWEAEEIKREQHEDHLNNFSSQVSGNDQIESTKLLRERFENMKYSNQESSTKPRYQINRFV